MDFVLAAAITSFLFDLSSSRVSTLPNAIHRTPSSPPRFAFSGNLRMYMCTRNLRSQVVLANFNHCAFHLGMAF
jgi:hypothetical protein